MWEMPFQSIKFQKFFGGTCPRTPLNCSLPCSDVQQIFPKSAPAYNECLINLACSVSTEKYLHLFFCTDLALSSPCLYENLRKILSRTYLGLALG